MPQVVHAVFPDRAGDDVGEPQQRFRRAGGVVDPQFAAQPLPLPEPRHEVEVAPVLARFAGLEDRLIDVPAVEFDEQSFQALATGSLGAFYRACGSDHDNAADRDDGELVNEVRAAGRALVVPVQLATTDAEREGLVPQCRTPGCGWEVVNAELTNHKRPRPFGPLRHTHQDQSLFTAMSPRTPPSSISDTHRRFASGR